MSRVLCKCQKDTAAKKKEISGNYIRLQIQETPRVRWQPIDAGCLDVVCSCRQQELVRNTVTSQHHKHGT